MITSWRLCAALIACTVGAFTTPASMSQPLAPHEFRVTLLGTGSPAPVMRRFGRGVLVQAGGKNLLIDSGRGVTQRLMQVGLALGQVDALFLTHLLIHQVAAAKDDLLELPTFKVILAHHTQPEEAGVVFSRVKPRLAV